MEKEDRSFSQPPILYQAKLLKYTVWRQRQIRPLYPVRTESFLLEKVEAEEKTNIGRMDISVEVYDGLYYIIELKLDLSADAALRQIKRKKYYEKYMKRGNTIHLLGINFSSKERNIVDWKEEISLFD